MHGIPPLSNHPACVKAQKTALPDVCRSYFPFHDRQICLSDIIPVDAEVIGPLDVVHADDEYPMETADPLGAVDELQRRLSRSDAVIEIDDKSDDRPDTQAA